MAYEIGWAVTPIEHRDNPLTWAATNHRELVQAENLVAAWQQIDRAPILVWCGNSHHATMTGLPDSSSVRHIASSAVSSAMGGA